MINYDERLSRLYARRHDEQWLFKSFSEEQARKILDEDYRFIPKPAATRYVSGAMAPVDPAYTRNTYEEGKRIQSHLEKLSEYHRSPDFAFQGSITNDTHIKVHSDIDLLVVTGRFVTLKQPLEPHSPYEGDPIEDLLKLRRDCVDVFNSVFTEVTVDDSGARSISLEGGSLRRKVDVVPSNWYHTTDYVQTDNKVFRGIQILDVPKESRITNFPFLHNRRIEERDQELKGALRKAIRFLKTLKADADNEIDISSYAIASLCLYLPDEVSGMGRDPWALVSAVADHLEEIVSDWAEFRKLLVPNHAQLVDEVVAVEEINLLSREVCRILRTGITE